MAKYRINIHNNAVYNVEIEADSPKEAEEKFEAYRARKGFTNEFRKNAKLNGYRVAIQSTAWQPRVYGNKKTYVQKFLEWYETLPLGTEYTNDDIDRIIEARTLRAKYTMKAHRAIRDILMRDQVTWRQVGVSAAGTKIVYRKGKVAA